MNAHSPTEQERPASPSLRSYFFNDFSETLFLGYVSGILISIASFLKVWHDHFIEWNIHLLWMPLVSSAVLLLALRLLTLPIALILPRKSYCFIASGFIGFFATFSVLASLHVLNLWAMGVLSLGISLQLSRRFHQQSPAMRRVFRYGSVLISLLIVITASGIVLLRDTQERQALGKHPPKKADSPNILFIVWDTVRADQVAAFQADGAPTPHLSELAKRGFLFERAIAPASWTLPSHTSMFTGKFPNELSTDWFAPIESETTMLAEILRDRGYHTAGFVANTRYCGRGVGMDQGFLHFEDYKIDFRTIAQTSFFYRLLATKWMPHSEKFKTRHEITEHYLKWHSERNSQRPFFAFLNYMDAHTPYLPDTIDGRPITASELARMQSYELRSPREISKADRELAQKCYRSEISSLDTSLGQLIEYLKDRNIYDNTIVIVVSDHGEHFGEHGLFYHGNSLYQPVVHVPLVISCPDSQAHGKRISHSVSLRNIAATILDCAGGLGETNIPGYSLIDLAEGQMEYIPNDTVYAYNSLEGIQNHESTILPFFLDSIGWEGRLDLWENEEYFLLEGPKDNTELYNIKTDPHEAHNLVKKNAEQERVKTMKRQLSQFLEKSSLNHNSDNSRSDTP